MSATCAPPRRAAPWLPWKYSDERLPEGKTNTLRTRRYQEAVSNLPVSSNPLSPENTKPPALEQAVRRCKPGEPILPGFYHTIQSLLLPSHGMAFIPPFACSSDRANGDGTVPRDAKQTCSQLRASTRAALATGYRNMLIDVLAEPMRRSSRAYDPAVHNRIIESVCRALEPALSPENSSIVVAVAGSKSAVELQQHFLDLSEIQSEGKGDEPPPPAVDIDILGASRVNESTGAVVVVDPGVTGNAILELRQLVRSAVAAQRPIIVVNHPQPGAVFKVANCLGTLPLELIQFQSVYTMAPFALRITNSSSAGLGVGRLVFMHAFPGKWQLWRVSGKNGSNGGGALLETPNTVSQLLNVATGPRPDPSREEDDARYTLVAAWTSRPDEKAFLAAVDRAGREDISF